MSHTSTGVEPEHHGWLDRVAISLAMVCAVHCLVVPVLIVLLPIIATSFFAHENFHLWMLLLVLPTTGLSIFLGCRRHKDKWVAFLSIVGLLLLFAVVVNEHISSTPIHGASADASHLQNCEVCSRDVVEEPVPMHAGAWINTLGGLLLASAHVRNFRLCRKSRCEH